MRFHGVWTTFIFTFSAENDLPIQPSKKKKKTSTAAKSSHCFFFCVCVCVSLCVCVLLFFFCNTMTHFALTEHLFYRKLTQRRLILIPSTYRGKMSWYAHNAAPSQHAKSVAMKVSN